MAYVILLHFIYHCVCVCSAAQSCTTFCDSTFLLYPWNSPGKNTGVSCHFLLQGIIPPQASNLCFLHWQADTLPLSHRGSPYPLVSRYQSLAVDAVGPSG